MINRVALTRFGDIDHVAVGTGGVLVIETKWSGEAWALDASEDDRVRAAVDRVSSDASRIRGLFSRHVESSAVFPVVVLWGAHEPNDLRMRLIDGVTVLRGSELRGWLRSLDPGALTSEQQEQAWKKLETTVRRRDAFDLSEDGPPPKSPADWARPIVGAMFALWLGLLAAASAWAVWRSFPLFCAAEAVFVTIGWVVLRRTRFVPVAIAWLTGVLFVGALVAVVAVSSVL